MAREVFHMAEEFGSNFITIEDEDGKEFQLELILEMEYQGEHYNLLLPADMDEEDPDYGFVILKSQEEDGEEILVTEDDDAVLDEVYDQFMERLFEDEETEE